MHIFSSIQSGLLSKLGLVRCRQGALLLAVAVAMAGCSTGGKTSMLVPVAGGGKVAVPLGKKGVEFTEANGVRIESASSTLDAEKKLVYNFAFRDAKARALRQVIVEDISDDSPTLLVEDNAPVLEEGRWSGSSRGFTWGDPELRWLATISHTMRVYRFTITFADGEKLVLDQGSLYPNVLKSVIRHTWGETY